MVGVSARSWHTTRAALRAVSAVLSPFLGDYARTADSRGKPPDPQHRTQRKQRTKAPRHARGVCFFLRIAQNLNIIAAPDKGCDNVVCRRWVLDRREKNTPKIDRARKRSGRSHPPGAGL